ncbi:unnamed protein product [Sphenostylis stenocarpa]|uniref:Uncharacterized protein n=1 Tax=Sphenostylis stenocarpa TaxID=92480 RepID=A0AA86RTC4_9FABA|nr:unnamed protein product [Sphenostylis stenocarpa]
MQRRVFRNRINDARRASRNHINNARHASNNRINDACRASGNLCRRNDERHASKKSQKRHASQFQSDTGNEADIGDLGEVRMEILGLD